jgi:hypothetical protein
MQKRQSLYGTMIAAKYSPLYHQTPNRLALQHLMARGSLI